MPLGTQRFGLGVVRWVSTTEKWTSGNLLVEKSVSALRAEPAICSFFANLAAEHYYFHAFSSQFVKEHCKQ